MQIVNKIKSIASLCLSEKYWIAFLLCALVSCKQEKPIVVEEETFNAVDFSGFGKPKLTDYNFFVGALKNLEPAQGVVHYELNSPLFSDYAFKKRFMKFPEGTSATFSANDVFEFPEGTILIKNFYYPADFSKPNENLRILETRLLINEKGEWKALPYIWNDEQTEAYLDVAGRNINVKWNHSDGSTRELIYSVPNVNQCKGCHLRGDKIKPIGPTARQLNAVLTGQSENQLTLLAKAGLLKGLPTLETVSKLVNYEDESAPVDARARAWLEINCAHCHRSDGPAKTSGLHLLADEKNLFVLGVGKPPVAAGRGSGGLKYDIVPGKPDQSILFYRIASSDPGVMMPELGKKLVHVEGVELVKHWINQLSIDNDQ
jgi:uncharacterized repeat protein (TIGR03806 family)